MRLLKVNATVELKFHAETVSNLNASITGSMLAKKQIPCHVMLRKQAGMAWCRCRAQSLRARLRKGLEGNINLWSTHCVWRHDSYLRTLGEWRYRSAHVILTLGKQGYWARGAKWSIAVPLRSRSLFPSVSGVCTCQQTVVHMVPKKWHGQMFLTNTLIIN